MTENASSLAREPIGPKLRFWEAFFLFARSEQPQVLQKMVRDFGDIVPLRIAGRDIWILSHPDLVREVWVTQARSFSKSHAFQIMKKLLDEGLLTSESDFHLRQRRLVQPLFLANHLRHYAGTMINEEKVFFQRLLHFLWN